MINNKYGKVYINCMKDCGENTGGYYCVVYSDQYFENENTETYSLHSIGIAWVHPGFCPATHMHGMQRYGWGQIPTYL